MKFDNEGKKNEYYEKEINTCYKMEIISKKNENLTKIF